ncbi:MAG TPA: 5'-nucleotidase C-terminal domain-containing protein, partial [bacterium]|nr:5'-nucleotidase C-terminal domain-containing protein [bacterium]
DLIASLESLAERLKDPDNDGCYPYFFGLRCDLQQASVDASSETSEQRGIAVEWQIPGGGWEPIAPDRVYRIATNSYLAAGRDGYDRFKTHAGYSYDTGFLDAEIFMDALTSGLDL